LPARGDQVLLIDGNTNNTPQFEHPAGPNAGNGSGPASCNPVDLGSGNALLFRPRPFGVSNFLSI